MLHHLSDYVVAIIAGGILLYSDVPILLACLSAWVCATLWATYRKPILVIAKPPFNMEKPNGN
jgi:hypothetical protein